MAEVSSIVRYLENGQIPWTTGYEEYKQHAIIEALSDRDVLQVFRSGQELPKGFGFRLDERIIEYPWVQSRMSEDNVLLMDAGGTLDHQYLLDLPALAGKKVIVYTLAPNGQVLTRPNTSYVFGDLRHTILADEVFQEIACISTLEHIGMDNTLIYTQDEKYKESRSTDYRQVLQEFRRLLVPNGRLLLTVPYGRYRDFGWLQQFDRAMLADAINTFGGRTVEQDFFRYEPDGWTRTTEDACRDCEYYDIHSSPAYAPDFAAAARAVACVQLQKA